MDAPPIQYCRTEDGVNIAYWTLGKGPSLVHTPFTPSDLVAEWEVPAWRDWYLRLAENFTVIKFDRRGSGMSQRDTSDFSLTALVHDLAAVVEATSEGQVHILASWSFGPPAIAYAALHPDRLRRLVLLNTYASGREGLGSPRPNALRQMLEADWDVATELFTTSAGATGAVADQLTAVWRGATTREQYATFVSAVTPNDASEYLARLRVPTLVLHPTESPLVPLDVLQRLAARIPNARLQPVACGVWPFLTEGTPAVRLINDFLRESDPASGVDPRNGPFRTLLFTDLESSTALTQSLGDAKAQEVVHGHNDAVRAALAAHDGEEVKHTGDGIMAAFGSAVAAVKAALQIQHDLAGAEVRVRIGLNAGEPIAEDDDYFGTAVQLAARVCDRAEPGQVLVSNVVRELCAGKGFAFTDQGEATLKGFPEPVRLFVVGEGA